MNFNTGRADLLGLKIKEIIRQVFDPYIPCPQCEGKGEIPSIDRDCGICKHYHSTALGYGECKKGEKKGWVDECSIVCIEFDDLCPMQTCPSCNGKKSFEEVVIDRIENRSELLDL